jgi:hypothetical protein
LWTELSGISWTVEFWFYPIAQGGVNGGMIFGNNLSGRADACFIYHGSDGKVGITTAGGSNFTYFASATSLPLNEWTHVAITISGSSGSAVGKIYLNGVLSTTQSSMNTVINSMSLALTGSRGDGSQYNLYGYLSNFRIVKNQILYTGNFTPATAPLTTTSVGTSGANVAASITGTVSTLIYNNAYLTNSGATAATVVNSATGQTFSPFGAPTSAYSAATNGGSGYFDGSGDNLAVSQSAFVATGDFTIEAWFYQTNQTSGYQGILSASGNGGSTGFRITTDVNTLVFWLNSSTVGSASIPQNVWHHVAISRTGSGSNNVSCYLNGVRVGQITNTGSTTNSSLVVGQYYNDLANYYFQGYVSGLRLIVGSGIYSGSTISIPTSPPTAITNTALLLNYTNAGVIDNAVSNDLETVGNAQISTSQYKWGTSSVYFDGTGDYLYAPTSPTIAFGTGDFTWEAWIYASSASDKPIYECRSTNSTTDGFTVTAFTSTVIRVYTNTAVVTATVSNYLNNWTHVAFVRAAGVCKLYVNGNQCASAAFTSNLTNTTAAVGAGRYGSASLDTYFTGYIADLRLTKGYARYLYSFTPPTAAFPLFYQAAATPSTDPYFQNTTLLLPGNGTNGAQNNTFLDSSTNAFTITRNGNTTQGTFTPFAKDAGRWGNYFSGGTYLNVANNTALNLAGVSFTIEAWVYCTALSGVYASWIAGKRAIPGPYTVSWAFALNSSGQVYLGDNSTAAVSAEAVPLNQWTHVAAVCTGTSVQMYVNGIKSGAAVNLSISEVSTDLTIGNYPVDNPVFNGYISNLRLIKSQALTTGSFTPPTGPVSSAAVGWTGANVAGSITGTASLVTCQSNRFVDNSGNNLTITVSGTPSVQTFSPFPTTASYDASVNGGSGYFDGSGDVLSAASNVAFALGTGDFTVETFAYYTAQSNIDALAVANWDGVTWGSNKWSLHLDHTTARAKVTFWFHNYSSTVPLLTSSSTLAIGQWYHVAVSRSGNTFRLFINGVLDVSATNSTSLDGGTNSPIYVGGGGGGGGSQYFTGYLSSTRLVKGTAVYTATFTTPTAPLTAVSGTSLLLNYTNGGIIDNAMSNDLETVGGAAISTTQSKFGGSSMYFDGSGDYLIQKDTPNLAFGTGDFTIEMWLYRNASGAQHDIISFNPTSTNGAYPALYISSGNVLFYYTQSANQITGPTINTGQWYHIALSRYSGSTRLFVDGSQVGSTYADTNSYLCGTNRPVIGSGGFTVSGTLNAYIDDLRITKGIARYVQNFTPPTQAFLTL